MILLRYIPAVLCGVPFLLNIPYMCNAWRYSPLDRWDWTFLVLFLVNGSFQLGKVYSFRKDKLDLFALAPLGLFAALMLLGKFRYDINALVIMGAVGFWWSSFWFLFGWRSAYCLIGSFLILALGCTSTTNWISYILKVQSSTALTAKFIAAGSLVIWDSFNRRLVVRRGTLCFLLVLAGGLVLLLQSKDMNIRSRPFLLEFVQLHFQDYLGRKQDVDNATRRFFAQSKVEQYSFANDVTSFGVLAVECGNDIHEIHPASHCLRTTGAVIQGEYPVEYDIHGTTITVNEIQALTGNGLELVVVWYSNEDFSTSNFLGFRRAWKPKKKWMTYQISTPVGNQSITVSQKRMAAFLNAIPSSLNPKWQKEQEIR